jgi:hypothetical protein
MSANRVRPEFDALLSRTSFGTKDVERAQQRVSADTAAAILRAADQPRGISSLRHIEWEQVQKREGESTD